MSKSTHTHLTVDDLSSDSEDEFPPGFLTSKLENKTFDDGNDDLNDDENTNDLLTFDNSVPHVEFIPLSYKERKFANKMRDRIEKRNIKPTMKLGPPCSAFKDLSLNVNATTTDIDLSGQILMDDSLLSLWTLISETTIVKTLSLARTGINASHGLPLHEALIKNKGSLESLNLKRNYFDDESVAIMLNFDSDNVDGKEVLLCNGKLRQLDLRGNNLSEKSGVILANAARAPIRKEDSLSLISYNDSNSIITSASPLPWESSFNNNNNAGGQYSEPPSPAMSTSSSVSNTTQLNERGNHQTMNTSSFLQSKVSRFDELNGIPTESLLKNEMDNLQFGSSGFGVAEVSLIGELLKTVTSIHTLDLSWNSDIGSDGAIALANTLSECMSPIEVLDLSGTRICDLDEKSQPVGKFQTTYGGNTENEPISVDSSFQGSGIVLLCQMLRSNKGVAKTLKTLCLNDNCLCEPYWNRNEDRPFEWQIPPNPYDRSQITENTEVLARVLVPGVGDRLVWEWHNGIVSDVKASIKRGKCEFAINFDDNRTQQMVNRASNLLWNKEQAREKAEYKALVKAAELKGEQPPIQKWAKHKPPVYILDSNIKIMQESSSMAALAELLKHGIPPPATAEELWKASQEKQALLKEQRLNKSSGGGHTKQHGHGSNTNTDKDNSQSNHSKSDVDSKETGSKKLKSPKKNKKNPKVRDGDSTQSPSSPNSKELENVFGYGEKSLASTASSWHISEGLESLETRNNNGDDDDGEHVLSADVLAFEAEAENVLNEYLQIETNNDENIDNKRPFSSGTDATSPTSTLKLDIDSDDVGSFSDGESDDDDDDNSSMQSENSEEVTLPTWAKATGGLYGEMRVGLQRLELKRCNIDDVGIATLGKGLEHPACPISALFLDGNFFGGESGAMGLSNALDLNRSLTFLGLMGCDLSMQVRREWAHALNSNSKSRLSSIAMDAFCIEQRPLKKRYDPLTHNHLHRASLPGHIQQKATFAHKRLKAVVTGKGSEQLSLDKQLAKYEGGASGLVEHKKKKKQALLTRLGINDDGNEPVVNSGFEKWKCKDHEEIISRSVCTSDVGMLATVLARNRDVIGLNLSGSSFDMEAFQLLCDSLSVRSRLPPPPPKRETDEEYEEDDEEAYFRRKQAAAVANANASSMFITKAISPLTSPNKQMKGTTLKFSNTHTQIQGNELTLNSPLKPYIKKVWLSSLSLAKVHLGSEGCAILTDVLADLHSLRYLCLRGCDLTDYGINTLPANNLISALDGTYQSVAPKAPEPHKFGKRTNVKKDNQDDDEDNNDNETHKKSSTIGNKTSGQQAASSSSGLKKSKSFKSSNGTTPVEVSTKYYQHPPNKSLAGKSSSFWKVPVEPPNENEWGRAPPLRFLDLSDNGLSAPLIWRCVLYMKNHMDTMKWMDLTGNMIYDLTPTSLNMEPMNWASHMRPPYLFELTLPMRQEILFAGEAIEWLIQPHSSEGDDDDMSSSFNTINPTAASKLTDEAYGEALTALTEKACHHGAPPLFLVTGKAAVEAKVEAVLEDKPQAYVAAREELRNSAWRQQRLLDLVVEIDAAKENVKRVFHRHALLDKKKEKKLKQEEEAAKLAKKNLELYQLKENEKDERKHMYEEELDMKKFILLEYKNKIKQDLKNKELEKCKFEKDLMFKEDEDVNGYISCQRINNNENEENDEIERCKIRKAYFKMDGAIENFELSWSQFNSFLKSLNVLNLTQENCNEIINIYFGENNRKTEKFHIYDALDLYKISKLAYQFYEVDIDNSGGISSDELSICLLKLGFEMSSEKCIELLKTIDSDNDGVVSLKEFILFFRYVKLETRLEAETKVIQASHGKKKILNLNIKMGMVVNPNGIVSKVIENGQAEKLGITVGCKIINCNNDIVNSLEELKLSISKAKKQFKQEFIELEEERISLEKEEEEEGGGNDGGSNNTVVNVQKHECEIIFVNPKEGVYARHALAKLRAESSRKTALAAEEASKKAHVRKLMAEKNAKLLIELNQKEREKAEREQILLKKKLQKEKEESLILAKKKKLEFEEELKKRDKVIKAEKLRIVQEELRIKKELQEYEDAIAKEKFKRETLELSANSQLGKLRNEQDELIQEGILAKEKANLRWGKEEKGGPNHGMLTKIPKKRRHRLRYVMAAVPQKRAELQIFKFAMALICIYDTKKTGPGNQNGRNSKRDGNGRKINNSNNNGGGGSNSRNNDVKIMTCELRCLRVWARSSLEESSHILQDLRHVLITRLRRSDVATWIRELLFRKSPKPKISIEHEDGSYLVYDARIGWIVRLELKTSPCNCEACQDHSMEFPKKSSNFVLPDVTGLLPETV